MHLMSDWRMDKERQLIMMQYSFSFYVVFNLARTLLQHIPFLLWCHKQVQKHHAPHHRHIGHTPSSLISRAFCMLLWWQGIGWVHRGGIPIHHRMHPVVFQNPLAQMSMQALSVFADHRVSLCHLIAHFGCKRCCDVTYVVSAVFRNFFKGARLRFQET